MESQNSESVEICRFGDEKNPLVISVVSFNGSRNLDIRRYYFDKKTKNIKPSTKGIFLKEEEFFYVFDSLKDSLEDIKRLMIDGLDQREVGVRTKRKEKIAVEKIRNEASGACLQFEAWPGPNFFLSNVESDGSYIKFNTRNKVIEKISSDKLSGVDVLEKLISAFISASTNINFSNKVKPETILEFLELEWSNHLR